jgi:hypothetical protein
LTAKVHEKLDEIREQMRRDLEEKRMAETHEKLEEIREQARADLEERRKAAAPKREPPLEEDLGKATILGIEVHGYRTTYPAGSISWDSTQSVNERWIPIAPGMKGLIVRWIKNDQKFGKETRELVKFTQGEPDPTIFHPPADYKIVAQTQDVRGVQCPQPSTTAPEVAPAK